MNLSRPVHETATCVKMHNCTKMPEHCPQLILRSRAVLEPKYHIPRSNVHSDLRLESTLVPAPEAADVEHKQARWEPMLYAYSVVSLTLSLLSPGSDHQSDIRLAKGP